MANMCYMFIFVQFISPFTNIPKDAESLCFKSVCFERNTERESISNQRAQTIFN